MKAADFKELVKNCSIAKNSVGKVFYNLSQSEKNP